MASVLSANQTNVISPCANGKLVTDNDMDLSLDEKINQIRNRLLEYRRDGGK